MGTLGVVRFEIDTKIVDEKDRLDRVGSDEERGAAQRGVVKDLIGLVSGRGEVIGNSDLE